MVYDPAVFWIDTTRLGYYPLYLYYKVVTKTGHIYKKSIDACYSLY